MHLELTRCVAQVGSDAFTEPAGSVPIGVGPLEVEWIRDDAWSTFRWWVTNRSAEPVGVRSVSLVFAVRDVMPPLRIFRNGYQSWSQTGVATFGVDVDPSTRADFEFLQALHHADQRRAQDGELRSEWVTAICDAGDRPHVLGFDALNEHDGTFRLRPTDDGGPELWVEAFLGDAVFAPGERRELHDVHVGDAELPLADQLDRWAAEVGRRGKARIDAPYQVGWCSWYHYFHDVTEAALRTNLSLAAEWPFEVFQLDDGYQAAIGDWLDTNDKFPSTLREVAAAIEAAGRRPGIWLAPFLVAPDSTVAREHPEWLARFATADGEVPLRAWFNPPWGGGDNGFMNALDTTRLDVIEHLEFVARSLVEAGFTYLKLDFTFAPSFDAIWSDPSRTPAQRVRAGYEAFRGGAGDDAFILGCGVPLGNVVGIVDANRIGQDVAPLWALDPADEVVRGYLAVQPSTQFAYGNTVARSFMHRRLWLNDPDCLMLRTSETELSVAAAQTWAQVIGVSGGMALVSDDLALLDDAARTLLEDTVAIGRAVDDAARAGGLVVCPDLLTQPIPHELTAAGYDIVVDPATGTSELTRP